MLSNYVVNPNDLVVIESESGNHVNLDEILNPIGHPTKLVDLCSHVRNTQ